MTTTTRDIAIDTANRVGHRLYGQRSSTSQSVLAEMELDGRSHYYDPGTRRYFGCRVLDCYDLLGGLILGTVESVSPPGDRRLYRCVFFDLLGNTIHRTEHETNGLAGWATAASARREFKAFAETLTVEAASSSVIERRRKEIERDARNLD